jgi:hypothetical protein
MYNAAMIFGQRRADRQRLCPSTIASVRQRSDRSSNVGGSPGTGRSENTSRLMVPSVRFEGIAELERGRPRLAGGSNLAAERSSRIFR